jgi:hypothetical protein
MKYAGTMWQASLSFVEIVGTIKNYHVLLVVFISSPNHGLGLIQSWSCLILKDPKEKALLSEIYNGQQQRLQAIVDNLTEIEELSEVSIHRSPLFVIFPTLISSGRYLLHIPCKSDLWGQYERSNLDSHHLHWRWDDQCDEEFCSWKNDYYQVSYDVQFSQSPSFFNGREHEIDWWSKNYSHLINKYNSPHPNLLSITDDYLYLIIHQHY